MATPGALEGLRFVNPYASLPDALYARVQPRALAAPELVHVDEEVAAILGLEAAALDRELLTEVVGGARLLEGMDPLAQAYAGHQFGYYVPRLGDGRAILLGQVEVAGRVWDLQLKGAGPTQYSRGGDGRAVLRSTIREYLAGIALAGLGIPTTRALALVRSRTPVYREQPETGAALLRVASSHVRFGTFEYAAHAEREHLPALLERVLGWHFPELAREPAGPGRTQAFLAEVTRRTAELVARWQAVGFCHGVLNTDNMSILGLTLDYGPYGFLDAFDAAHVCNHSDPTARYAYQRQPEVGLWNLGRLAQALRRLPDGRPDPAEAVALSLDQAHAGLEEYGRVYLRTYLELMRQKLGLRDPLEAEDALLGELFDLLQAEGADYTRVFRALGEATPDDPGSLSAEVPGHPEHLEAWLASYWQRAAREGRTSEEGARERRALMRAANPSRVLRNYLAEQAIRAAEAGDDGPLERLVRGLRDPFRDDPEFCAFSAAPP
ncbi:MAG: YdiU family protein, partial [Planctomycetes bacterium]|nr:YdiU family protein [Planctomycetota bacterium]